MNSWWVQKYPKHECNECQIDHMTIPTFSFEQPVGDGKKELAAVAPFEVLGMVDGPIHPGHGTPLDTPSHITGLLWGFPQNNRDVKYRSLLCHN